MDFETGERLDMLDEARELLEEAIHLVREAVRETPEENSANAYIIPHLEGWLDREWTSIGRLREAIEERAYNDLPPAKPAPIPANSRSPYEPLQEADIAHLMTTPWAKLNDPAHAITCRDRADVFYKAHHRGEYEKVIIERPERDREQIYDLVRVSPASRARLLGLIFDRHWSTRQTTPAGWHGVSTE